MQHKKLKFVGIICILIFLFSISLTPNIELNRSETHGIRFDDNTIKVSQTTEIGQGGDISSFDESLIYPTSDKLDLDKETEDILETRNTSPHNLLSPRNDIKTSLDPSQYDADTFVTQWDTWKTSSGSTNYTQVKLPLDSSGEYNFEVDWGDGTSDTITSWDQSEVTHNYDYLGVYDIIITGTLKGWRFNNGGDKNKLIEIAQWGNISLGNSGSYFKGAYNLKLTATDAPDLSETTTLHEAFRYCYELGNTGNMNNWNVSGISDMSSMFYNAENFNQSISDWDVSNVKNMDNMFGATSSFNQPIGNWDVSNVTDMSSMFYISEIFNQPVDNWDVSNVTDMGFMFAFATAFNQSLSNWNVSGVSDMNGMFYSAENFNQPINSWNVSSVTNMESMFQSSGFNQSLSNWDVSNVTNMKEMFHDTDNFNQAIDMWNVSGVTNMASMFNDADAFNQPIEAWDVSSVTNMGAIFYDTATFNQSIGNWDVSGVTNMASMFYAANAFNQPIADWDVSGVTNMNWMFRDNHIFNQQIGSWNVSSVSSMANMFQGNDAFNQQIGSWNVSSVTSMANMFQGNDAFNQPIGEWDVSSVTDMGYMFDDASAFNQPIGNWNISSVYYMRYMFRDTGAFNQSLANWDVSGVVYMNSMFQRAASFDQPLGNWNLSDPVTLIDFLAGTSLSVSNYDNLLLGWSDQSLINGATFNAGSSQYSSQAADARQHIIDTYDWDIIDGGLYTDITIPNLNQPENISILYGSTGNSIQWSIGDKHPDVYNITLDGTLFVSDTTWSNGTISVDIDGLDIGSHNIEITVYDTFGNVASNIVKVVVMETNLPVLNSQENVIYENGSTGNIISWLVGDKYPDVYNITLDGSIYVNNTAWSNGTISVDIDGLDVGNHTLEIMIYDTSGNMASDNVQILVLASIAPELNNPDNISYEKGSTGNEIVWTLGDLNPDVYNITLDGSVVVNNTDWTNGTVSLDIDGLNVGNYTFVIRVYDTLGNMASDQVTVEVYSDTSNNSDTGSSVSSTPIGSSNEENTDPTSDSSNDNSFIAFNFMYSLIAMISITSLIVINKKNHT